jgi:hypothetical protein
LTGARVAPLAGTTQGFSSGAAAVLVGSNAKSSPNTAALIFGSLIFEESAICISPYQPADASLGRNSGRYNPAYYCHSESFPVSLNTAPYSYHPA